MEWTTQVPSFYMLCGPDDSVSQIWAETILFSVILSLFSCPLWSSLYFLVSILSLTLFSLWRLFLSELPVQLVSKMWVQRRILRRGPDCRALLKSQWDNYSPALPILLTWQHSVADHQRGREKGLQAFQRFYFRLSVCRPASLPVCLTHCRFYTLTHT